MSTTPHLTPSGNSAEHTSGSTPATSAGDTDETLATALEAAGSLGTDSDAPGSLGADSDASSSPGAVLGSGVGSDGGAQDTASTATASVHQGVGRRSFLRGAAGAGVLAAGAASLAACSTQSTSSETTSSTPSHDLASQTVPFDGEHQAGIDTPGQAYMTVVGVNLADGADAATVTRLMKVWTLAARPLTQGAAPLAELEPEMDTTPANLTITLGVGQRVFQVLGRDDLRPDWLHDIPAFSRDQLHSAWGQTDFALQFCCDDPTTLAHAVRFVLRAGQDYATPVWTQQGFLYAAGTKDKGSTPRNLFGLLDGTVNPRTTEDLNEIVWIKDGPAWLNGGTAMVIRRIRLNMDTWDIVDRGTREVVFGRKLDTGAPLTGTQEHDDPDFTATDSTGLPIIDPMSHMARAHYTGDNTHERILRRAYNYDLPGGFVGAGITAAAGGTPAVLPTGDSGLIFTCFQQNPDTQFTPIQKRLDEGDRLNEWATHIGSAVYACPPGTSGEGDYWLKGLLEG